MIDYKELIRQRYLLYRIQKNIVFDINRTTPPVTDNDPIAYTNVVPFTKMYSFMNTHVVSGNISFSVNPNGALPGAVTLCRLVADGVSTISFTGINEIVGSNYDNTLNIVNYLVFFFDGVHYFVNIYQDKDAVPVDVLAPTLQSAIVSDGIRNRIVLTYNEPLDTLSTPAIGAFTVSGGKTVTSVTVTGSEVRVNVNTDYSHGDVITVSYTAGASPVQDTSGNNAANLVAQAVTNNISPPDITASTLQSASVEDATPNIVTLVFDETINPAFVPPVTQFTFSGGRNVTNVSIVDNTVVLTVDDPWTHDLTIRVGYLSNEAPYLQDMSGNTVSAISLFLVTNNIAAPGTSETALTFGNFTGTMTQVGTVLSASSGAYASNLGRATQRLVGDGYIQFEWLTSADKDLVLGFNSVDANASYTEMEYFCWAAGGTQYYTGHAGGNILGTGVTPVAGDKVRIRRTGDTFVAEYYRGGSWTALPWTGTPATTTADMYITVAGNAPCELNNPVGSGVV